MGGYRAGCEGKPCAAILGRILEPPPKARGNGARLCAEHQPQRHGEATRLGTIRRLWASALAAAGPSDTAAVRWWFQENAPLSLFQRKAGFSKAPGADISRENEP